VLAPACPPSALVTISGPVGAIAMDALPALPRFAGVLSQFHLPRFLGGE
jgi:hypothetical protein